MRDGEEERDEKLEASAVSRRARKTAPSLGLAASAAPSPTPKMRRASLLFALVAFPAALAAPVGHSDKSLALLDEGVLLDVRTGRALLHVSVDTLAQVLRDLAQTLLLELLDQLDETHLVELMGNQQPIALALLLRGHELLLQARL